MSQIAFPVVTSNVVGRTFLIQGSLIGTAFAIDHASKQYLVTARHIVKGIESGNVLKLFHNGQWKDLLVNVVGIGKGEEMDVAVLACSVQLAPPVPLIASSQAIQLGQPILFLGYPFGWGGGGEQVNRGIPMPFVKAGIISAIVGEEPVKIYLDAHNNEGFSGGPVIFIPEGKPGGLLHVAGVVVNYPAPLRPIVDGARNPLTDQMGKPTAYIQENPGIAVAISIKHVVELIEANPIGFLLPAK